MLLNMQAVVQVLIRKQKVLRNAEGLFGRISAWRWDAEAAGAARGFVDRTQGVSHCPDIRFTKLNQLLEARRSASMSLWRAGA